MPRKEWKECRHFDDDDDDGGSGVIRRITGMLLAVPRAGMGSNSATVMKFPQLLVILERYLELSYFLC